MIECPIDKIIVLYDGQCGLCNRFVRYLLHEDPADHFRYVSQQSAVGQRILTYIGYSTTAFDSIVVYHPNKAYYTQSQAVFYLCKYGSFKLKLGLVFQLFPKAILDVVYNWIAKNRYKWFGKSEDCALIPNAMLYKFLS